MTKLAGSSVVKEGTEHWQQHCLDVVEGGRGLEVSATDVGVFTLQEKNKKTCTL